MSSSRQADKCRRLRRSPDQESSGSSFSSLSSSSSIENTSSSSSLMIMSPTHTSTVLKGLNDLRSQRMLLDVTLITPEGKKFPVHRVVLASCSEYFRVMFTTRGITESNLDEIMLKGVTGEGVQVLIEYAYTSHLRITGDNVQDVLSAASHLRFDDVVNACSSFLSSQLDLDNCVDILILSEMYSLSILERKVYCFICANLSAFEDDFGSPDYQSKFSQLTANQVENLLCLNLPVDCDEFRVLLIVISWIKKDYWIRVKSVPNLLRHIHFGDLTADQREKVIPTIIKILKDALVDSKTMQSTPNDKGTSILNLTLNCSMKEEEKQPQTLLPSSPSSSSSVKHVKNDASGDAAGPESLKSDLDTVISSCGSINFNSFSLSAESSPLSFPTTTAIVSVSHLASSSHLSTTAGSDGSYAWENTITISNQEDKHQRQQKSRLLNRRGMEAVIVKIGGFTSTSGVTNEITYHCQTENKWKFLTCIPHVDQCNFGSCVFDNFLYVVGGCFNQCSSLTEEHVHPYGFRYDPLCDSWTTISPMMTERCRFPLIVCGGFLYALGGVSCDNVRDEVPSSPCEAYDPLSDSWASILPIPGENQRSQHAAVAVDDRFIFISGGLDSSDNVLDSMYSFDTKLNSWDIKPFLPTPRADHTMICYGNRIIVCGGWCEDNDGRRILMSSVESFDLATESWDPVVVTDIPTPRFHSGIVLQGDILWIMGGFVSDDSFDDRGCGLIECFNLKTKEWSTPSAYPQDIWEHSTAVLYVPTSRREEDADVC